MELKPYQKKVIADLTRFLEYLSSGHSAAAAYKLLWQEKNVPVGFGGLQAYHANISKDVPDVCFKVPTGGGKTYLAASSVKPIFDSLPKMRSRAVVWLVPSEAILTQTYKALSSTAHPYRQRLDVDFGGNVEVYSKTQLLNGQNFNPTSVTEQLSVFVLSYDSFRTSKKEGRKAFQENGNLAAFPKQLGDKSVLLPDTDETALIQVVRALNPLVIVDESHHATSTLSVEMLANFNPCFVLDLTATPKKNSNIISFVDARQLKAANMVKLPVIVYNRKAQSDVYYDAINLRRKLEKQALNEQQISGRYIRPIVLFQAQPRVGAESTTYEKIRKTLINAGIAKEHIAIKTGEKDELKNVDLLSASCPIRYIITVNALKEGWDCPFAYVLATVANRSSTVEVEQILGRVLRLPYTRKNTSEVLNLSYVITSSDDFHDTLEKVVAGLNSAGFSDKDCRVKDVDEEQKPSLEPPVQLPISIPEDDDNVPSIDTEDLKARLSAALNEGNSGDEIQNDPILGPALIANDAYEAENAEQTADSPFFQAPQEVREKMNVFRMNDRFADEASMLRFPQFMLKTTPSLFSADEHVLLEQDHLSAGFTLKDKDAAIDFNTIEIEMAKVDTDDDSSSQPKAWMLQSADSTYFKEWFNAQPSSAKLNYCKGLIKQRISKLNCINDRELKEYIDRVVETMSEDQLSDMEHSAFPYVMKIEAKVKSLLAAHRADIFDLWLEQERIECIPNYALKSVISPTSFTSIIPKSLYSSEEEMNDYEQKVVWAISALPNIKWWHRNISRLGFQINGAIHAYPDLIAMTTNGKLLMIETKGDHLDNDESRQKARLGYQWAQLAGSQYRYFMVFQTKSPEYPGAYSYERFMEIIKGL